MDERVQRITPGEIMYNRIETWILERVPRDHVGGFSKWVFKVPTIYYRLGLGWMVGRFILLLTTTGRKTGKKRQTPLEYEYDPATGRYRIAAGWGGRTDWYRNLRADPHVTVQVGRKKFEATAEPASVEEIAKYMMRLSQRHPRMERIWNRFADCPVDGTRESYLRAARSFPAVWLTPVSTCKEQEESSTPADK